MTTEATGQFDSLRTIALIGTYLPRQCGIATFTTDLCEAMASEVTGARVFAVAMNDTASGYSYPPAVRFQIEENSLRDYRVAAELLNLNRCDAVCVQHEYGIFGGEAGKYVLFLLRELRVPIVTALHTVLKDPGDEQRFVLKELVRLSERLVVLSNKAITFLKEIYGAPESKIALIPHGIPDSVMHVGACITTDACATVPFADPNRYKDALRVEGRRVILTFGLLSPGKGIEYMIEALPEVAKKYPDVLYVVLGATHPHIRRRSGEEYRINLQRKVLDLGVENHVLFHNRFVSVEELCEFLGAADLYVAPCVNEAQIVSGTLAYALGSGRAVVSTPFWYAQDILAEGRGCLVPFRNSKALAAQCINLLGNDLECNTMRKRAYTYCRQMVWKEVARQYLRLFAEVKDSRRSRQFRRHSSCRRTERQTIPGPASLARTVAQASVPMHAPACVGLLEMSWIELPEIKLDHLRLLTDDTGIVQHAKFTVPDRLHGYCTDDNARALVAVLMAIKQLPDDPSLEALAARYLSFLSHAFNEENGRFRNFMTFDRRWAEQKGSEDSHGRAVWALGVAAALGQNAGHVQLSVSLLQQAVQGVEKFVSPRSWAFIVLGIHSYLKRFPGDSEARHVMETLAERLYAAFKRHATDDWPWPEESLSYVNPRLPHALLLAGCDLQQPEITEMGLRALEWLARIQTGTDNCFSPVGTAGWYRRGGTKARFDQQPIEAQAMLEACVGAHKITRDERWLAEARRCFEWFLGRNDLRLPLFDYASGGCRDGIHPDRVNENQGAESTVAWLLSLLTMYQHRGETAFSEPEEAAVKKASVISGAADNAGLNRTGKRGKN